MERDKKEEAERFIRFLQRLREEGLSDVGIINVDPETGKSSVLKIKEIKGD